MYLTFYKPKKQTKMTNKNFSIDDLFEGKEINLPITFNTNPETKTIITENIPNFLSEDVLKTKILPQLQELADRHEIDTINEEYETFYIPKRNGGRREINAPKPPLMLTLKTMKDIFQYQLYVLYHNAAYAYVPKRNSHEALKVHQKNKSRWFLKLDIKDFFPNCSFEFVSQTLHKIYPFNLYTQDEIDSFLWVCFKDDQLPQGTPMSPMLTNLIMIPVDYAIQEYAYKNKLIYTRYADDILISAYNNFDWHKVVRDINAIFRKLETPFKLKKEKIRYGSSAGRNWNLGLMLNKDNQITVGYKKKKRYKAMLNNLMIAEVSGHFWERDELYYFQGITSYYLSIEPKYFKELIQKYETNYNVSIKEIFKREL
jgi:hypothetical protein